MTDFLKALQVLSQPIRLRLLGLLEQEELTVAELQEILGMGQSRISSNLGQLKRAALVTDRRVGKNIFYQVSPQVTSAIMSVIKAALLEIPQATQDQAALRIVLRKRKDKSSEYFNRLAGKFGRTYVPGRSWQGLAHALLRLMPPMIIADLGAGEGTLSQLLARSAKRVIAVDISEKMVEFGSALAREHGINNLEYRLGDIEEPPIEDNSVDLALFSQALHHTASPTRAIREAERILRPGGRILILDLTRHTFEQARELYAHVWLGFSEVELSEMLTHANFQDIEIQVVAKESQSPYFQTVLATGRKQIGK